MLVSCLKTVELLRCNTFSYILNCYPEQYIGHIQFDNPSDSVSEGSSSYPITLSRTGGTFGETKVRLTILGITATADSDYDASQTTREFKFIHGSVSNDYHFMALNI